MSVITLTTDFGNSPYQGIMEGVILGLNPKATIVDLTHGISPQNVLEAAFVIHIAHPYFPPDTVHVIVVDPEVGTQRRSVVLRTPKAFFVCPDNGILSYILNGEGRLTSDMQAVSLTNPRFWLTDAKSVFSGRDVFAPVAAHLSLGVPLTKLGEEIKSLFSLPLPRPEHGEDYIVGHVIYVDHFGNLITDIKRSDLPSKELEVVVGDLHITGISSSYSAGDIVALWDSSDNLEIAACGGSAGRLLNKGEGDNIYLRWE
jgi:hypothetical protein